jgi:hypothetical protein
VDKTLANNIGGDEWAHPPAAVSIDTVPSARHADDVLVLKSEFGGQHIQGNF